LAPAFDFPPGRSDGSISSMNEVFPLMGRTANVEADGHGTAPGFTR
jgi:hypothetical protein